MKTLIAGPCVHEHSVEWLVEQAEAIREQVPPGWAWVFKCSFDKGNRTRHESYRGLGLDETMRAFEIIKKRCACLLTTDIHEPYQAAEISPLVDIIQIPAALSRQTDLIRAAGAVAACVNLKCGTNVSPAKMGAAVEKARSTTKVPAVWLTYRGTAYGNELVFDPLRLWKLSVYGPTFADITHAAQNVAGVETKGTRDATLVYGRVAMALDVVDGLFIEAHPEPHKALSDPGTQVPIRRLRQLIEGCKIEYRPDTCRWRKENDIR